jgi:hypothetical protein
MSKQENGALECQVTPKTMDELQWILQETNVSYIHCHHPGKSQQLYAADKVKFTLGRGQNNISLGSLCLNKCH